MVASDVELYKNIPSCNCVFSFHILLNLYYNKSQIDNYIKFRHVGRDYLEHVFLNTNTWEVYILYLKYQFHILFLECCDICSSLLCMEHRFTACCNHLRLKSNILDFIL